MKLFNGNLLMFMALSCAMVSTTWLPLGSTFHEENGPLETCSQEFITKCSATNEAPEESVEGFTCLPQQSPFDIVTSQRRCYRTCAYQETPFSTGCARCFADEDDIPVTTQEGDYSVYRLRSPGKDTYPPNTICDYRAKCGNDETMYYTVVEHKLEPQRDRSCPDSLTLSTDVVDSDSITCGEDSPSFGYSRDSLFANFKSNGQNSEFGGFLIVAFCVNSNFHFNRDPPCKRTPLRVSRMAREIELVKRAVNFPVPWKIVKRGECVRFKDFTVTIETKDGELIQDRTCKFENVLVFQIYDGNGKIFKGGDKSRVVCGPGKLIIGNGIVIFISLVIDPELLLAEEERRLVSLFTGNLYKSGFFDGEGFILPPVGSPGSTAPTPTDPPTNICDFNFSDEVIMEAEENVNNCKGFVRAAAQFFLAAIEPCRARATTAVP